MVLKYSASNSAFLFRYVEAVVVVKTLNIHWSSGLQGGEREGDFFNKVCEHTLVEEPQ